MIIDEVEDHVLVLQLRDGRLAQGEETGMNEAHNLFKDDLLILDIVHLGMVLIHIIEVLDELVDGIDVLCVHDDVHYDYYHFLVLLAGFLGVVALDAFLEHLDEFFEVLLGFRC